jgi:hypothetical protein
MTIGARGRNISAVVQGTSTVATASVQIEINNTVAANLGYDDVVDAILSILNYVRTDKNLSPGSRVLGLKIP